MDNLMYEKKNAYEVLASDELEKAKVFCEGYKQFLDYARTELYASEYAQKEAAARGYEPFEFGKKYSAGDKVYFTRGGKACVFVHVGEEGFEAGFNIAAAHIDCPRLDIKCNPLYEDGSLAYLDTHYYGGIVKYQWLTIPLMLCGAVYTRDGSKIDVRIGEDEGDPVFCITDLLPHLGKDIQSKTVDRAFNGEALNVLIGSAPDGEADKDKTKTAVMKILHTKYGITERDFQTAELSAVPAQKARDLGVDRSMILAFGQDDRSCAYPAFTALMDKKKVSKTAVCVLADREEVGSMGITGLRSSFMYDMLTDMCLSAGCNPRKAFGSSSALSADVSAAYDPAFAEVYELKNSAKLNCGPAICKFTGARGKSGSSEAGAEFMARLLADFDRNGVMYQLAELGKVDQGGGGTVAQFLTDRNIETVDIGVPILSMHAPYEAASKTDIYMLRRACDVFFA